jgi:hypothetical protein
MISFSICHGKSLPSLSCLRIFRIKPLTFLLERRRMMVQNPLAFQQSKSEENEEFLMARVQGSKRTVFATLNPLMVRKRERYQQISGWD